MSRLAVLAVVLSTWTAVAAPPEVDIPEKSKAPAAGYFTLTPKTDAKSVVYISIDGLEPFPSDLLANKTAFVLSATGVEPGEYRFVAVAAGPTGEQTVRPFVVVFGTPPDNPPDPKKPDPKKPDAPDAELLKALSAAYSADVAAGLGDAAGLRGLTAAMRGAALTANDQSVTTRRQLVETVSRLTNASPPAGAGQGRMTNTRRAIGGYLNGKVGTTDVPLDPPLRSAYAKAYTDIVTALEAVGR